MFIIGLLLGLMSGLIGASVFAAGARKKGIEDANAFLDAVERDERTVGSPIASEVARDEVREREYSG